VEKVDPMGRLVHKVGLLVGFVGTEGLTGGRVGRLVGLCVAIVGRFDIGGRVHRVRLMVGLIVG